MTAQQKGKLEFETETMVQSEITHTFYVPICKYSLQIEVQYYKNIYVKLDLIASSFHNALKLDL